jgi:hypothetical protein
VPPGAPPVTTPVVATTGAIDVLLLVHVPPGGPLVKVVVNPTHTLRIPVITAGKGYTVTIAVV